MDGPIAPNGKLPTRKAQRAGWRPNAAAACILARSFGSVALTWKAMTGLPRHLVDQAASGNRLQMKRTLPAIPSGRPRTWPFLMLRIADCQFNLTSILQPQRTAGSTGRTAASRLPAGCRLRRRISDAGRGVRGRLGGRTTRVGEPPKVEAARVLVILWVKCADDR